MPGGRLFDPQTIFGLDAAILAMNLRMRRSLELTPTEWLVFLAIITAAIQRYARAPDVDPQYRGSTPLAPDLAGRISGRRVSEALHLPAETVRQVVRRLIRRGLVREDAAGLHGKLGILSELSEAGLVKAVLLILLPIGSSNEEFSIEALTANERLVTYAIGNTGLSWMLSLERQYGLSPAVMETFLFLLTATAVPAAQRELARLIDMPRITLRRHLAVLADKQLAHEASVDSRLLPGVREAHLQHPEAAERLRLLGTLIREFSGWQR